MPLGEAGSVTADARARVLDNALAKVAGGGQAALGKVGLPSADTTPTGLVWDGQGWRRGPVDPARVHRRLDGTDYPPQPVGVGWWVWSASQHHADSYLEGGPGRHGICVAVGASPDGEVVYECVERYRRTITRLSVAAGDVWEAALAGRRDLEGALGEVAMASAKTGGWRAAKHDRRWLADTLITLGALAGAAA